MVWQSSLQCTELVPPMDDFSNSLLEVGCNDYHAKPVEFPRLLEQIEAILKGV
jgi:CheY-like chemotaxis protein